MVGHPPPSLAAFFSSLAMPGPPAPRPAPPPLTVGTVLVVDDDADMRLYVRTCLGVAVTGVVLEAADGDEALRLARAEGPDLVISDVVMPGLDGEALCRALRADPATAGIPLLLVSGEARLVAAGAPPTCADGSLAKPFNAARLRAAVARLLPPALDPDPAL